VRLLLDTHIAFWLVVEPETLSRAEQVFVAVPDAELAVSVISLWELRIKWQRPFVSGVRKLPASPADMLALWTNAGIPIADLTADVVIAELMPAFAHSDPFDELLLMHAQQTGRRLLTRDRKIADHPIALVAA